MIWKTRNATIKVDGELDALVLSLDKVHFGLDGCGALTCSRCFRDSHQAALCVRSRPELDQVRTLWPALLAGQSWRSFVAMGTEVAALLVRIDTAVAAHKASSTWRRFARARAVCGQVNGERQSLAGERGKAKPAGWQWRQGGLFRRLSKSRAKPVVTLSAIDRRTIKEAEAQVAVLKTQKAELEADAKAEAAALASGTKEVELVELRKLEAVKEKAKSLQNELGLHWPYLGQGCLGRQSASCCLRGPAR